MRTGISILGILISVAAVVMVSSIGAGAQREIERQVATMGNHVIVVMPGSQQVGAVRASQTTALTLTTTDASEIHKRVPAIREVCWGRRDPMQVVHGRLNWRLPVVGINPGCFAVRGWELADGEYFTQVEMDKGSAVAVIGQTVVEKLFHEDDNPVGATVVIKQIPFLVIGVLQAKGAAPAGSDQDDIVFIPFSTAQRKVHGAKFYGSVEAISLSTFERDDIPTAVEYIRQILRERHRLTDDKPDDFSIRTQLDLAATYETASQTLVQLLLAIASIAALVGGIGIMNILLVSVTERTKEIGVRMAVGARRGHIMAQFLIEAMTISLVGGCLGIVFGVLGARVMTVIAGWPTIISADTVGAAFVFSLAVGLFFGLYPANKAARLNPIDALRYE
jgi:putative ABC transport system permease protein